MEKVYTEIELDHFYDRFFESVPFSKKEIELIESEALDFIKRIELDPSSKKAQVIHITYFRNLGIICKIFKNSDEWYYLNTTKYYKCDQLDGLIECIRDNL